MEEKILTGALLTLGLLMLSLMPRALRGPRFTDRIVAVNSINTMVTASICLLSRRLTAPYLLDVALRSALSVLTAAAHLTPPPWATPWASAPLSSPRRSSQARPRRRASCC